MSNHWARRMGWLLTRWFVMIALLSQPVVWAKPLATTTPKNLPDPAQKSPISWSASDYLDSIEDALIKRTIENSAHVLQVLKTLATPSSGHCAIAQARTLHAQYLQSNSTSRSSPQDPNMVFFTLSKGNRSITYMGEAHGAEEVDNNLHERLADLVQRTGEPVFVESNGSMHGARGEELKGNLLETRREREEHRDKSLCSIILSLPLTDPTLSIHPLEASELTSYERSCHDLLSESEFEGEKDLLDQERKKYLRKIEYFHARIRELINLARRVSALKADSKVISNFNRVLELKLNNLFAQMSQHPALNDVHHLKAKKHLDNEIIMRNIDQGMTLDQNAPIGHSWAIGGANHAAGVKEYLMKRGWTEVGQ